MVVNKSMMLVNTIFNDRPTFSLIPTTKECPYVEGIYDTEEKVLALVGTSKKECFALVKALDADGKPIPIKKTGEFKEERLKIEKYQEYYLSDKQDIEDFLNKVAENYGEFPIKGFI